MPSLQENIASVSAEFDADKDSLSPQEVKQKYLSSKGLIKQLFAQMGSVCPANKKECGQLINELRAKITEHTKNIAQATKSKVASVIDITRQPAGIDQGTMHPISIMPKEATHFFERMGFEIIDDQEIETVANCFDKLRTPDWHPARDSQDTFYLEGNDLY